MDLIRTIAEEGCQLTEEQILGTLHRGLSGRFAGGKVLVLIPDHTRTLPLPFLFRSLVAILQDTRNPSRHTSSRAATGMVSKLDFMVALGTHPALPEESLNKLVGITAEERATTFKHIGLLNHAWDNPSALATIGVLDADEIKSISGERWHPSLPDRVDIRINKAVLDYDHILILGPTFPHEVVGFSGGAKYLFPGISGSEMINATHWLGALAGVVDTIGLKETPVRAMIHAAATRLRTPVTLAALVVEGHALSGLFVGDMYEAWSAAVELSARRNVVWCEKPYRRVLSCAPEMYDELWTAAKAMYKLEPVISIGGELIIFAPHLSVISRVHGEYIHQIGYHILPYFLENWDRFKQVPLGVLAHSTHLRGSGKMDGGFEKPNVRVTLASRISREECASLNLGYLNPDDVQIDEWRDRQADGILFVPKAGEILYRLQPGR